MKKVNKQKQQQLQGNVIAARMGGALIPARMWGIDSRFQPECGGIKSSPNVGLIPARMWGIDSSPNVGH